MNQVYGHAVVGIHAATFLPERVIEGRGELQEQQAHVRLTARDAPWARSRAIFQDYLVRQRFEGRPVVTQAGGIEGALGPVEAGMVVRCRVRLLSHARIVAPGSAQNICHLADAASRQWGILNPLDYSRDHSPQTGRLAGSPVSARGGRRRCPGRTRKRPQVLSQSPNLGHPATPGADAQNDAFN